MEVNELTDQQALRVMRAEYQRMETQLDLAKKRLAALLWLHGPMQLPKTFKHIPNDLYVHERADGKNIVLTATLTTRRRVS